MLLKWIFIFAFILEKRWKYRSTDNIFVMQVWYLKPDDAMDIANHPDNMSLASTISSVGDEHLVFKVINVVSEMREAQAWLYHIYNYQVIMYVSKYV